MNQQSSTTRKPLTSERVLRILGKAGIPQLGTATTLPLLSRTGNPYVRKNADGSSTLIRIFNVQAFATAEDANEAAASWKAGTALEKAGKGESEEAQQHFKDAYNKLMSFSVLEENAHVYENAYEVTAKIEPVPAGEAKQLEGIETVIGLQNVRPVTVGDNRTSTASMFVYEEPVVETKPNTLKGAKARADAKAGK